MTVACTWCHQAELYFFPQVIDIMGDKVGKPFKAVVKRANNVTETLTVIPDEANPDM